jgi:hypothetical protein
MEWLTTKKRVAFNDAEKMANDAIRARSATIRRRAVMNLVFSGIGVLLAGLFAALYAGGRMRRAWYLAVVIGTPSVILLGKSVVQLLRGDSDEPLE